MRIKVYWSIFISTLLLISCSGQDNTSDESSVDASLPSSSIAIEIVGGINGTTIEYREIRTEQVPQRNCGGSAEVENVIERTQTIAHTIDVGAGFSVNASGSLGISGTNVELGTEIASQFGYSYGVEESISRSLVVKARAGTNMRHELIQTEVWRVGDAIVTVNGQENMVPFSFRDDFSVELGESVDLGCSEANQSVTAEPFPTDTETPHPPTNIPSPTVLPTNTPEPTPTSTSTPEPWPITVVVDYTQESTNWPNITRTIVKVEIYEDKSIWFVEYRNESPERRFLGFNWDTYIIDSNGDLFTLSTALPENTRIESERRLEYQFEFDSPTLVPGEFVFVVRGEMGGFAKSSVHFEEARIDIVYSIPSD